MTPLRDYGAIGDCHTAALVSSRGTVDWWCAPRFDSPPVLDAILGGPRRFPSPAAQPPTRFAYEEGTNVLRADWTDGSAWWFMPYPRGDESAIVRLHRAAGREVAHRLDAQGMARGIDAAGARSLLEATRRAWRSWLGSEERPADVERSLLALKLLTYEPTGAVIAAPTTSLPETIGGVRNWDYRYAWIRDTAFCAEAFKRWGKEREVERIARWLAERVLPQGPLRVLYTVDGAPAPDERTVPLPGYEASRPVRMGNGAIRQRQLDAYGHAIETLHVCELVASPLVEEEWPRVVALVDEAIARWREPDNGIWELPAGARHFTYSKAMAWYALDQAIAIAEHHRLDAPIEAWTRERDVIASEVLRRGVDTESGAFVQAFDIGAADAATLRIGALGLVPPDGEVAKATIGQVVRELDEGGLLRRYATEDGLPGREGCFIACTFWLAEALARAGDADGARAAYERARATASPLGLYAEEFDPHAGRLLGNFPQALSHAAHLHAAASIARRLPA